MQELNPPTPETQTQTVADLQLALSSQCKAHPDAYLVKTFGGLSADTPLTVPVIAQLCQRADDVRRHSAPRPKQPKAAHQVAFHGFIFSMMRICARVVRERCRGYQWLAEWHSLSAILSICCGLESDDFFAALEIERRRSSAKKWNSRSYTALRQVRQLFGLPKETFHPDEHAPITLLGDRKDPALCLAQLIHRLPPGSDKEASRRLDLLVAAEQTSLIGRLAADHRLPDLLRYFLAWRTQATPPPNQLPYTERAAQCDGAIAQIFAWESRQPNRPRQGKKESSGELAPRSKKIYAQVLGHGLVAADHVTEGPATLLDIFREKSIAALQALLEKGNQGEPAYSHAVYYRKLADYSRKGGAVWELAPALLAQLTEPQRQILKSWTPNSWPKGADSPGAECETLVDRVRAALQIVHRPLQVLTARAEAAPFSLGHLRELAACQLARELPLTTLYRALLRLEKAASAPHNPHRYDDALILAYLACSTMSPPRVSFSLQSDGLCLEACEGDNSVDDLLLLAGR